MRAEIEVRVLVDDRDVYGYSDYIDLPVSNAPRRPDLPDPIEVVAIGINETLPGLRQKLRELNDEIILKVAQ